MCVLFFLATIMTNLSNICTIRRRAGHSWVSCKANLRREKLIKIISQSLPQVGLEPLMCPLLARRNYNRVLQTANLILPFYINDQLEHILATDLDLE